MAAVSALPPSNSRLGTKSKLRRISSDFIDPLYYNQLLEELRQHQDTGTAYYGNFVYEQRNIPSSLLLPSGTPIFQSDSPQGAAVLDRLAPADVSKESAAVKFLVEPPASVRGGTSNQLVAGRTPQRVGSGFKSPAVTAASEDLKPAVEAVKFIEKAQAHYKDLGPDGWKTKLSAQLVQRARQWEHLDLVSTPFSEEEVMLILVGRFILGNSWTEISRFLPGRSGKMVKGYWHSKLRPRYHRHGWKGRELSPPPELHKYLQQKPGSAASEGLKMVSGELGGDDSDDEEPREEAREETNDEALAREHALMQAALAAKDPAAVLQAYHLQYERLQPGLEEQSAANSEWEDRCFICKDGGELLCCQEGHEEGGDPCWKVYHAACLGTRAPSSGDSPWHCPRHSCVSDQCSEPVQSECTTCPTSYCDLHLPAYLDPQPPKKEGDKKRVTCDRCRALRGDKRSDTERGGAVRENPTAVSERKRRQRQREKDEAKRLELERQKEKRDKDRRKREEEEAREVLEQPEWVQVLNGIKTMPTNNGGPIVTRIEKAIGLARGHVHPEVIEQLQLSVSAAVYKSNSAGNTRNQALAAVDLHADHERIGKQYSDKM